MNMAHLKDETGSQGGQQLTAAYIPFKTFQTSLSVLAEGVAPTLDRTAWPTFSNIVRGQVLGAYKFLGLVGEQGIVQDILKELVAQRDSAKGKAILADLLKTRYQKVALLAAQNGTIQNLQDAMREQKVSGSTLEKAIRFWVDAAKFAGIRYPATWERIPRSMAGGKKRRASVAGNGGGGGTDNPPGEIPDNGEKGQGSTKTLKLRSGATVTLSVSANLLDLAADKSDMDWFLGLLAKFNEYTPSQQSA